MGLPLKVGEAKAPPGPMIMDGGVSLHRNGGEEGRFLAWKDCGNDSTCL